MENNEIISKLSAKEKVEELGGKDSWYLFPHAELGLNEVHFSDGPYGIRECLPEDSLFAEGKESICFPTSSLTAASFDRELLYKLGSILGKEARSRGIHCLLGPAINIKRNPLCGRNFEYVSEDPYLTGELAASYIKGVEDQGVATSIKHFALNNQESFRMNINSVCDIRTMREIYLKGFEIAIKKANPGTIMASYNKINGDYACESSFLLRDILRDEWGYKGLVISDWGAVNDPVKAIRAGLNEIMPVATKENYAALEKEYNAKEDFKKVVDESLNYTIDFIKKYQDKEKIDFDLDKAHEEAVNIAKESIVLLKNENNILPLKKREKVAFIGEYAITPHYNGKGSSLVTPYKLVTPLEAVEEREYNVSFAKGFNIFTDSIDLSLESEAIELAKKSDKVVMFLGTNSDIESENYDRRNLDLFINQIDLFYKIYNVNKNIVVVLQNGAPVEIPFNNEVKGLVEAYLGGEGCGEAIADLLYGLANPCGRLAETMPLRLNTIPSFAYYGVSNKVAIYKEAIYVGYRYYETKGMPVLYPFGYGLSYSNFKYSDFNVDSAGFLKKNNYKIKLSVKVTNDSDFDGKEVIQVYISKPNDKIFNAKYELVDFKKVFIKAHESAEVEFILDKEALKYFDVNLNRWNIQNGKYTFHISKNSHEHIFHQEVEVKEEDEIIGYDPVKLKKYFECDVRFLNIDEYQKLFNNDELLKKFKRPEKFTMNSNFSELKTTWVGRNFANIISKRDDIMKNRMVYVSIMEMPFRSLCTFGGGHLTPNIFKYMIKAANGEMPLINYFIFLIKFARASKKVKF